MGHKAEEGEGDLDLRTFRSRGALDDRVPSEDALAVNIVKG
jgi:hypothetical protein